MRKSNKFIISIIILIFNFIILVKIYAQISIQGDIVKAFLNTLISGLTVSLILLQLSRSVSIIKNQFGQFFFYNISIHRVSYYIEVYWNKQLIYRKKLLSIIIFFTNNIFITD